MKTKGGSSQPCMVKLRDNRYKLKKGGSEWKRFRSFCPNEHKSSRSE